MPKPTRWLAAAGASLSLTLVTGVVGMPPAHATPGTTVTIADPTADTVDPLLFNSNQQQPRPTTSSPSSDVQSTKLESLANGHVKATFTVTGPVPAEGSVSSADYHGPSYGPGGAVKPFLGGSYLAMYNNTSSQTNNDDLNGGCARVGGVGRVRDFKEHYQDGFYQFIGLQVGFDGQKYIYTAEEGYYDPAANGGFIFNDLSQDQLITKGVDWNVTVTGTSPATITVEGPGKLNSPDTTCASGVFVEDFAHPGDSIDNVFGLTTNDLVVVLPVAVPLDVIPGQQPLQAVGGFVYNSDWTAINPASGGTGDVFDPGLAGGPDVVGPGPTCWTPTFGGLLPQNPLWVGGQPCHIDLENNNPTGAYILPEYRQSHYAFNSTF